MTKEEIKKIIDEQGDRVIELITDSFDFDRVHKVMKTLNWIWASVKNEIDEYGAVPNQVQIYKEAVRQCRDALKDMRDDASEKYTISSGGLEVSFEIVNESALFGSIAFVLERSDNGHEFN